MPALLILESPDPSKQGQWLPLTGDQVVLGRDRVHCGVHLDCPPQQTSRQHARIVRADGDYFVEDLHSRNHTFVNDQRVTGRFPLRSDDVLRVGSYTLLFSLESGGGVVNTSTELSTPWETDGGAVSAAGGQSAGVLVYHSQDRTRMFLRVSVELNRVSARGPLVERVCELLLATFQAAEACHVLLLDPAGRLAVAASKARPAAPPDAAPRPALAWQAIASRRAQVIRIDAPPQVDPRATTPFRSGMFVPMLAADGRSLGVIELDGSPTTTFTGEDLELLAAVGGLTAVAVERVRLQDQLQERQKDRQELAIARNVQLALLPQTAPRLAGYDFFAAYSPARSVGGDYYDYIPLSGGRLAVLLGDVAGKGVPAALLVAKLSSEVRFSLLTERTPAAAVGRLNERLLEGGIRDRYVTLVLCVIDPRDHTVTIVNAGHPPPLVYRADEHAVSEAISNDQSGVPVGIVSGFEYTSVVCRLGPADFLVLYTDGVPDATNADNQDFGFERVPHALIGGQPGPIRVRDSCNRLLQAVRSHAREHPQTDDIAIVGFGRHQREDDQADSGMTDVDLNLTEWAGG